MRWIFIHLLILLSPAGGALIPGPILLRCVGGAHLSRPLLCRSASPYAQTVPERQARIFGGIVLLEEQKRGDYHPVRVRQEPQTATEPCP